MAEGQHTVRRRKQKHRQWRERKPSFGAMVQMDGSHHDWFEGRGPRCVLMAMVDDATNQMRARFAPEETARASYDVMEGQHEDGTPQAVAVYDQKEGTPRCEQAADAALLATLPALDGKIITADALHCQRPIARTIVEKGGDYLLQIKGNQPKLLAQAQGRDALPHTPFLSRPTADTGGSKSGRSTPSPSNP